MPRFVPKRYEQIFAQMIAKVVARTDLSDVGDSSVVKHILAAAARADDEQYFQMSLLLQLFNYDTATGEDLDARAKDLPPGAVERVQAVKSTGLLVFTRKGTTGTTTIPSGTRAKTGDGKVFVTTAATTITPSSPQQIAGHGIGRDSTPVAAVAETGGAAGNVAALTIVKFLSKPAGVDEVTNPTAFTGGLDKETDDSFRSRIYAYLASLSRSTVNAIEAALAGQEDPASGKTIRFVKVLEDPLVRGTITVYVDDGTGAAESVAAVVGEVVTAGLAGPPPDSAVGGETRLNLDNWPVKTTVPVTLTSSIRGALTEGVHYTLNPASGLLVFSPALVATEVITADYTHYTGLIQFAQKVVDGDPGDRLTYPGLRAAGILARVLTPQILVQDALLTVTVEDGYDQAAVRATVKEAVKSYINGLGISGDVVRNEIIRKVMEVDGVYNLDLTTPAGDIILLDDQLARTTDANITVS